MNEKIYSIEEIRLILNKILKNMPVYEVVLFGSYAKNSADSTSDLDLMLDTQNTLMGFKFLSLVAFIEDSFKKPVDAFEKTDVLENSRVAKEIKETGVIVYEKQRADINK